MKRIWGLGLCLFVLPGSVCAQNVTDPSNKVRYTADAILTLTDETEKKEAFAEAIRKAIEISPAVRETKAAGLEAQAVEAEAKSARYPTIDLALNANRSIARNISDDPDSVIERSRGKGRVDFSATVEQKFFDFGATVKRLEASRYRVDFAETQVDRSREKVALTAIGAWYNVVAYNYLGSLIQAYIADQSERKKILNARITNGVSAASDMARLESAIASLELQYSQFQREKASAEASFREVFGPDVPFPMLRAPLSFSSLQAKAFYVERAERTALVRGLRAQSTAANLDADAAKLGMLPSVGVGIDAGRYGAFEPGRNDYDIRARMTVRYRLLGPEKARAAQAKARALGVEARLDAGILEARREAEIAYGTVDTLQKELDARLSDYVASRTTRDAELARFRISRGTLFDVLTADNRYFDAGLGYIRALSELDSARYVLLARSGDLLSSFGLEPATELDFNMGPKGQ
jgi:outer membrane protein, adhesin transport system